MDNIPDDEYSPEDLAVINDERRVELAQALWSLLNDHRRALEVHQPLTLKALKEIKDWLNLQPQGVSMPKFIRLK